MTIATGRTRRRASPRIFLAGSVLVAAMFAGQANAVTVTPVILDLKTAGMDMSGLISVDASLPTPLPVELKIEQAAFDENGLQDTGKPSDDLIVFPPTALIQPGRTQTFRIQYVGDPALKQSRHYFVTVAQLPVQLQGEESQIQVLYNFQVVVNVGPAGGKPHLTVAKSAIEKDAAGKAAAVVYIRNDGSTYGYLDQGQLRIVELDAAGKQLFSKSYLPEEIQDKIGPGLVGTGVTRRFPLPISLPTGEGKLEVTYSPASE